MRWVAHERNFNTGLGKSQCAYDERTRLTRFDNPYTFTGRRLDDESGIYYYRNRYYHAQMGRFVSRDPMGHMDGMSLYGAYFAPDGLDPLGTAVINDPLPARSLGNCTTTTSTHLISRCTFSENADGSNPFTRDVPCGNSRAWKCCLDKAKGVFGTGWFVMSARLGAKTTETTTCRKSVCAALSSCVGSKPAVTLGDAAYTGAAAVVGTALVCTLQSTKTVTETYTWPKIGDVNPPPVGPRNQNSCDCFCMAVDGRGTEHGPYGVGKMSKWACENYPSTDDGRSRDFTRCFCKD